MQPVTSGDQFHCTRLYTAVPNVAALLRLSCILMTAITWGSCPISLPWTSSYRLKDLLNFTCMVYLLFPLFIQLFSANFSPSSCFSFCIFFLGGGGGMGWKVIEVLHGLTRVKKRGPSCEMPSVAWRLVVRQSWHGAWYKRVYMWFLIIHGGQDVWIWWSQHTLPLSVWCAPISLQDCFLQVFALDSCT